MRYGSILVATVALVAASGCHHQQIWGEQMAAERIDAAVAGWLAAGNTVTPECVEDLRNVTLLVTSADEMNALCDFGREGELMGCRKGGTDWDGAHHTSIIVDEALQGYDDFDDTVEHELRHELARCAFGDSDTDHDDVRAWYTYRGRDIR